MRTKILFCHFDLGNGGAEKVLINLLRGLDYSKYDITLYLLDQSLYVIYHHKSLFGVDDQSTIGYQYQYINVRQ